MGRKNPNPNEPASDQPFPRKARKTTSHKSSSSACSSSAPSVPEPFHQTSQGETVTSNTPASEWTPKLDLDISDIPGAAIPAFAALQRNPRLGQTGHHNKELRSLAPAPGLPTLGSTPESPEPSESPEPKPEPNEVIMIEGRPKFQISRLKSQHSRASSIVTVAASFTDEPSKSPEPRVPIPEPIPTFDPSKCVWNAIRDVRFFKDGNINILPEDLCALLRFRYEDKDPQMETVELCHLEAMNNLGKRQGTPMYDALWVDVLRKDMRTDLQEMMKAGRRAVSRDF